jgi:dolichol-phosphate mannosyltransferase
MVLEGQLRNTGENMTFVRSAAAAHGRRLVLFGAVGMSGVAVNTAALWAMVSFLGMHHLLAALISSEISILTNFALNDRFTFKDRGAGISYRRRAAHYNAVALSGMVLSLSVLAALTLGCGMYYLAANLLAMGVSTVSNYALNMRFTWALRLDSGLHRAEAAG